MGRSRVAAVDDAEHVVLRGDLRRAVALGLIDIPAARVARAVPTVGADAGEVEVRRELAGGAPLVLVHEGPARASRPARRRALIGAVVPTGTWGITALGPSLVGRLT